MSRLTKSPLEGLLAELGDEQALVKVRTLKLLLRAVLRQTPIAGPGMQARETPDGLVLSAEGGAAQGQRRPFEPRLVGSTDTHYLVELEVGQIRHAGMVCSPVPAYGGVSLLGYPNILVPATGLDYVIVAKVLYSASTVQDWVTSAVVTSLVIEVHSAAAVPVDAPGVAVIWLASVSSLGEVVGLINTHATLAIDDDGTATETPAVHVFFELSA